MTFKEKFLNEYKKVKLQINEKNKKLTGKIKGNSKIKNLRGKIKNNKYIITILIILIVLISGFIIGSIRTSKEAILKKINIALEQENYSKLQSVLEVDGNEEKLTKEKIKPIMEFYKSDPNRRTTLITSLKNNKEMYGMKLKNEKKFLNNKYKIEVKYSTINIITNSKDAKLIINGVDQGTIDKEKKVNLLAPGEYLIELESQNKYSNLKMNKKISLTNNETLNMNIDGVRISAKGNFENATVFINDKDSGITVKEFKEIGPFPIDGSYALSAKYKTPWGTFASGIVKVSDIPEVNLDISLKKPALEGVLAKSVNDFYESVFKAIDLEDKSKILASDEKIQEKIYSIIHKNSFIFKNKYKINNSKVDFEKSSITYEGENIYRASMVVELDYNVRKEILGVPLKSENHTQNFFTNFEYKNGKWKVYDVENFSLKSIS